MPSPLSTHVADMDATAQRDNNDTSNVDCIRLKDQIIPNQLLSQIFGTAEKATENLTTYCNVLQTIKSRINAQFYPVV